MKQVIAGVFTAVLVSLSAPVRAQAPVTFEAGAVMGVLGPYGSFGVVKAGWMARVSGGLFRGDCYGAQVNAGRVVRAVGDARHTVGLAWAGFENGCGYDPADPRWQRAAKGKKYYRQGGQFASVTYTFQVRGFFVEAGPGFGSPNPFASNAGLFRYIYGQVGYVTRLGGDD